VRRVCPDPVRLSPSRLLERARRQQKTVCLLSNLAPYNQAAIERKFPHFFPATDHNLFSYELGLHKPSPEIFLRAAELIGTEPSHCLFLDDTAENVDGARRAGMIAHLFENDRAETISGVMGPDPG
jgi:HAD superfamily hydrolase (TIGR01509 family)